MNLFDEFIGVRQRADRAARRTRARGFDLSGRPDADPALVQEAHDVLAQRRARRARSRRRPRACPTATGARSRSRVALAAEPRLLFLDEPTAGLGSDGRARLAELVRELKGTLTIVIIEHDMGFLFSLADTISVIHWGQVIARGTPAELRGQSVGARPPTWGGSH